MLLDELIKRQEQLNMTDAEFAHELGVSRQMWQFTRTGKVGQTRTIGIGQKVVAGAYRRFPELAPQVLTFLGHEC